MVLKFHYIKNKNNIFQSCEVNEKYKFISFYLHNPIDCKNFLKFTKKALEENLKKDIKLALRGIIYDEAFILSFDDVIKQDKRVLIALAERQDYRLRFCLSEEQKEDVELLKEIILRYPSIFLGLSPKLKENKELEAIYEKNLSSKEIL